MEGRSRPRSYVGTSRRSANIPTVALDNCMWSPIPAGSAAWPVDGRGNVPAFRLDPCLLRCHRSSSTWWGAVPQQGCGKPLATAVVPRPVRVRDDGGEAVFCTRLLAPEGDPMIVPPYLLAR